MRRKDLLVRFSGSCLKGFLTLHSPCFANVGVGKPITIAWLGEFGVQGAGDFAVSCAVSEKAQNCRLGRNSIAVFALAVE